MMFMAFSLIALGYGYHVFLEATDLKHAKRRQFGRIVGIYIMTVAFALSVGAVMKWAQKNGCFTKGPMCAVASKICPR